MTKVSRNFLQRFAVNVNLLCCKCHTGKNEMMGFHKDNRDVLSIFEFEN